MVGETFGVDVAVSSPRMPHLRFQQSELSALRRRATAAWSHRDKRLTKTTSLYDRGSYEGFRKRSPEF